MADPVMEVISQRRRALTLAAALMGISLVTAWGVSQSLVAPLPLGKRLTLDNWPASFRLPEGWNYSQNDGDGARPSELLVVARGERHDTTQLTIRHGRHPRGTPPQVIIVQTLIETHGELAPDQRENRTIALGPLAGTLIRAGFVTVDGGHVSSIIAAACLPDGDWLLFMITGPTREAGHLERTLQSICQSVEFPPDRLSRDPAGSDQLRSDVPAGMWRIASPGTGGNLRYAADATQPEPFNIEAWETRLIEPRTLEALAGDRLLQEDRKAVRYERLDIPAPAGREAVLLKTTQLDGGSICGAVRVDGERVVMVLSPGGLEGVAAIESACRTVLTSAALPARSLPPVEPQRRAGAAAIREVLAGLGNAERTESATYWLIEFCGKPAGFREQVREPGEPGEWNGRESIEWRPLPGFRVQVEQSWSYHPERGDFDSLHFVRRDASTGSLRTELRAWRAATDAEISLQEKGDGRSVSLTVPRRETLAPEGLEDDLYRALRGLEPGAGVLVERLTERARAPHWVRIWRPAEVKPGEPLILLEQADHDPSATRIELDRNGAVVREFPDPVLELHRASRRELRRKLSWYRDDERRLRSDGSD